MGLGTGVDGVLGTGVDGVLGTGVSVDRPYDFPIFELQSGSEVWLSGLSS